MTLTVDIERKLGTFQLKTVFETGEGVTALFGRSGAGKTSVVNAVAGILRPDRGRIVINGEPVFDSERGIDVATPRRRIGYVFQEGRLFPHRETFPAARSSASPSAGRYSPVPVCFCSTSRSLRSMLSGRAKCCNTSS